MKTPTQPEVQSVLLKLQTEDRQSYFFEQLRNPEWLEPLRKEKVFAGPPPPIARGDSLYFPQWPPLKYLKNVAAERPEQVTAIVDGQSDLFDVMLRLPAPLAARLSVKADDWLKQRLFTRLPIVFTTLSEYLLRSGEVKAGLRLAHQMLAVEAQERSVKNPIFDRPRAVGIISDWYYSDAASKIAAALLEVAPLAGLKLLSRILLEALNIERRASQEDDYSAIWMKDIDRDPRSNDVKEILAYGLLQLAKSIVKQNLVPRDDVYAYLRRQPSTIFQRILIRLVAHVNDIDTAAADLVSPSFWRIPGINPERNMLANAFLGGLTDDQFEAAMAGLRAAVPVDLFIKWTKTTKGLTQQKMTFRISSVPSCLRILLGFRKRFAALQRTSMIV